MVERLKYEITARDKSKAALRSLRGGLEQSSKAANALKTAIGAVAIGLAVRRIASFTQEAIRMGDNIAKTADKVGLSVVALQRLTFAADLAGVSQDKLQTSVERFTKRLGEASLGTGEAKTALENLKVSFADSEGRIRSTESVLIDVADAFTKLESPQQKAALAAQLFGREGVALVNLLNLGSAGLVRFGNQAEAAGAILSERLARSAEKLNDQLTVANTALTVAKTKLGLAFADAGIIDAFTKATQRLARALSSRRALNIMRKGLDRIAKAANFVIRNFEQISGAIVAIFAFKVLRRILTLSLIHI